jgi:hypothetical protein
MGRTPDRYPGIREEEAILLRDEPSEPTDPYSLARVNGKIKMVDDLGEYDPRGGGALPAANDVGDVLLSVDGSTFTVRHPLTGSAGWLVNDDGTLLVTG